MTLAGANTVSSKVDWIPLGQQVATLDYHLVKLATVGPVGSLRTSVKPNLRQKRCASAFSSSPPIQVLWPPWRRTHAAEAHRQVGRALGSSPWMNHQ